MVKINVHKLALEVGVSRQEILAYLAEKGHTKLTGVSFVPDNEVENIRAAFGRKDSAPEVPETSAASSSDEKASSKAQKAAKDEADKPKKSGIVRVVRQQNASSKLQQRRPRRQTEAKSETAAPAGRAEAIPDENLVQESTAAPAVTETVSAKQETLKDAVKTGSPESVPAAKAEEEAAKEAPAAAPKEPAEEAADKTSAPKSEQAAAAPDQKEAGAESPESRKPETEEAPKKEAAKKDAAAKAETAPEPKSTAPAAQEKKEADTGFRNGRIIRSFGAAVTQQMNSSRTSRDRNSRGGAARQGTGAPRSGQGRPQDRAAGAPGAGTRGGMRGAQGRPGEQRGDRAGFGQGGGARGTAPQRGTAGGGFQRNAQGGRPGQGAGFGGGRGAARPAASGGDGALAHKTSRDFRKDGKDRERTREERRELGHGRGENNAKGAQGGRKQFNRLPKALQNKTPTQPQKKEEVVVTEIKVPERITVRDLAERMHVAGAQLVKELFMKGNMVTLNHELPYETAEEIALEHDIICEKEEREDVIGALLQEAAEDESDMVERPPVVCVMGHVDHGKTSLLDAIRDTHVTDREAGGITQHIGAYMVEIDGRKITFLDTPGHEAFTAMRMRGANATDIAVLVVAADDGVMPQTVEAINHAKAAEVEIIVAVNKIDKPGANVDRVKQELSEYGLIAEDWGGSTVFCPVSAKTRQGLDDLLEMILTVSEMHELKANPDRKARGIVLEARLDKGRGPVASILIQKGTLHQGDFIACGAASGKVRAMTDENGRRLQKATPSMPVEIIGLSSVPEAGEVLVSMDSDKEAKEFAAVFVSENKKTLLEETKTQMSLDDLFNQIKEGSLKELPIVVKADVQGSVEAVSQSLLKLSNEEVVVKVIHGGVGAINESDVALAAASNAIIIGFNVRPDNTAKMMADNQKVDIHLYNVIYEAIEDVERALKGMRAAVFEEKVQGHVEIRQIFKASGVGNIAGAYVKDGIITRSSKVRIFRGDEKIFEGELASLKRFKDDVKEVREGFECGLVFDGFGDFAELDMVEAYTMVEVARE